MYQHGDKIVERATGRIYDYGYISCIDEKDGQYWHVCYEEGECNMQDAVVFKQWEIAPICSC